MFTMIPDDYPEAIAKLSWLKAHGYPDATEEGVLRDTVLSGTQDLFNEALEGLFCGMFKTKKCGCAAFKVNGSVNSFPGRDLKPLKMTLKMMHINSGKTLEPKSAASSAANKKQVQ